MKMISLSLLTASWTGLLSIFRYKILLVKYQRYNADTATSAPNINMPMVNMTVAGTLKIWCAFKINENANPGMRNSRPNTINDTNKQGNEIKTVPITFFATIFFVSIKSIGAKITNEMLNSIIYSINAKNIGNNGDI